MSQVMQTSSVCLALIVFAHAATADDGSDSATEKQGPAPLSVAPSGYLDYLDARPDWVEPRAYFEDAPHSAVIVSGPYASREESLAELQLMKRMSVEDYLKQFPGSEGRADFFPFSDAWIDRELVIREPYEGRVKQDGEIKYVHAVEIRFTDETQSQITAALHNLQVGERLAGLGFLVGAGLFGLICSSTVLGFISRRVQRRESVRAAGL